jgi:putative glutamine amidotransferase
MQQLNALCGGNLYLHLPEDQPRALPHFDPTGGPHRHAVLLEPNTRLDEIYGGGELRVNSAHHQAVRQVGSGLRVAAVAPDGVIEAIEAVDGNWFCVGVQWHPESETASALDMQLFECFIQASLRQSQPMTLAA